MKISVCDGCGKQFKPYGFTKKNGEGNCMTIVKVEKDGIIYPKARLELCQNCMDDVWDFVKSDLVTDESPLYDRFHKQVEDTAAESEKTEEAENPEDVFV